MNARIVSVLVTALIAACSQQTETVQGDAAGSEAEAAPLQLEITHLEALAAGMGAPTCDLDGDIAAIDSIRTWLGSQESGSVAIAGRDLDAWTALARQYHETERAAADMDAFIALWRAHGGQVDEGGYLELGVRLARGDQDAIAKLCKGPASSFASMVMSALGTARERGDRDAMARLAEAMLESHPTAGNLVAVAAYLHELGREDEAQRLVERHANSPQPMNLGSRAAAMYLARHIESEGIEAGFQRVRDAFGAASLTMALVSLKDEYRLRERGPELVDLYRSPALIAYLAEAEWPLVLAPTMADAHRSLSGDEAEALITAYAERIAAEEYEGALDLARSIRDLAEAGCNDDCLRIPLARLDAAARAASAQDGDIASAMALGQAAAGMLDAALASGLARNEMGIFAIAYATGRRSPDYLGPLLFRLDDAAAHAAVSRLAAMLYWKGAPMQVVADALLRLPPDSAPDTFLNTLAGSAAYDDPQPERATKLRQLLAAWSQGLCTTES